MLTAGHCTSTDEVGVGAVWQVYAGADVTKAQPSDWMAVKEVHPHPMFDSKNPTAGSDIGIVILAQPTTLPPIPINHDALSSMGWQGQNVRIIGYGLSDGFGLTGAGVKRQATVPMNNVDNLVIDTGNLVSEIVQRRFGRSGASRSTARSGSSA